MSDAEAGTKGQSVARGEGASSLVAQIAALQDYDRYRDLAWEGTFEEYLQIVRERPTVTRNAFQRVYDMVISYGTEEYIDNKKKLIRYNFFRDEADGGKDAVFGLDIPLMRLMNVLKAASEGYGPERRVILLHGPVGSSKSTIARLLKKGLERYSAKDAGALYSLGWATADGVQWCPMNEEPLHMIPERFRKDVLDGLNADIPADEYRVKVRGELCPFCRYVYSDLLRQYEGDWTRVIQDVRVKRLILSEKDRSE